MVMDVHTGDILAMVSSPTLDPNWYVRGITRQEWQRISELHAEKNRATQENYMPGSIFKPVVGMAALEAGLNPEEIIHVQHNPAQPNKGYVRVGNHTFKDSPSPVLTSSGRRSSVPAIPISSRLACALVRSRLSAWASGCISVSEGAATLQDGPGSFPGLRRLSSGWTDGNTGNLCIGQDPVWVTPIQIAVLTAAIANGGDVLWPRLVDHINRRTRPRPRRPRSFRAAGCGITWASAQAPSNHAPGYAG